MSGLPGAVADGGARVAQLLPPAEGLLRRLLRGGYITIIIIIIITITIIIIYMLCLLPQDCLRRILHGAVILAKTKTKVSNKTAMMMMMI